MAVLGAPIDIGAPHRGTRMGPALRTAGLLTVLDGLGFEVRDHGDLSMSVPSSPTHRPTMPDTTGKSSADRALSPRAYSSRDPARRRSFSAATTRCRWVR